MFVTIYGALHPAARYPASKIAVARNQPVYTPFRSILNKRHRALRTAVRRLFNGLVALQYAAG